NESGCSLGSSVCHTTASTSFLLAGSETNRTNFSGCNCRRWSNQTEAARRKAFEIHLLLPRSRTSPHPKPHRQAGRVARAGPLRAHSDERRALRSVRACAATVPSTGDATRRDFQTEPPDFCYSNRGTMEDYPPIHPL